MRVYPRFVSIPPCVSDNFVDFYFSELLLYKPFHEITVDIGEDSNAIISNWESLNYDPWHVERRVDVEDNDNISESESETNEIGPGNITELEWEIISWLYHGQTMEISEIDMLGRRDIDKQFNWSNHYKSDQYTTKAINFICRMRESGCILILNVNKKLIVTIWVKNRKRHLTLL